MKNYLIVFFSLIITFTAKAQQWSLEKIIDSVAAHNPVVKMYSSEIQSMDEAAKGARAWMPPTVSGGLFMTPYNIKRWQKDGDMIGMGTVAIGVEQMFPNRKKLNANEKYMLAMSGVAKENLNFNLNTYIQDAKKLYYEWIVLQKKQTIVTENDKMLEFMIRNAEIRYKNGLGKISAYYKAKAALGISKNMQLMYQNEIREKRIRLNTLMGRNALENLEIEPKYEFNDYTMEVFDESLFNTRRSELKAIDREIALTQLKSNIEKQNMKPEFGVRYEHMTGLGGQPMQFSMMLMAKLPMVSWSSKMNRANLESLKWKEQALQAQKKMLVNEYCGMAYGMRNDLELNKQQLKLFEDTIIPALKNNYKTMQLGYEQNTEELFMLFDSWEKLNMVQIEFLETLAKALNTQSELDRLLEKR